jgi:hypothetical protein
MASHQSGKNRLNINSDHRVALMSIIHTIKTQLK